MKKILQNSWVCWIEYILRSNFVYDLYQVYSSLQAYSKGLILVKENIGL